MEPLAAQRRAILDARYRLDRIGNRAPLKDTDSRFLLLRHPERLQPAGWKPGRGWQRPQPSEKVRESPVLDLMWWSTDAAAGEPWLPATQQQDERWEELFGEWKRQQEQQVAAGQWPPDLRQLTHDPARQRRRSCGPWAGLR
jgi:hypothetical protein